ncbi:protein RCC2 homolog [Eurytemora carolleeae]|uniref:protein RCC2 homolog n=1 Tax=Eurytemora carolleeae TaxID=1294199 RepID=UPI000C7783FD|nr:protein RCC2 homolog [Eurytemora carolleeae]|eukprot:XP_023334185.1 protein RCC2 homolog [Eurytemora affinis]
MSAENGTQNGGEKRKVEDEGDTLRKREKLEAGTLLFSGATDWKEVGRKTNDLSKSANTQWSPVRLAALKDVQIASVGVGSNSAFCMAISEDGKVYAWGRNEMGQLGLGDTKDRFCPTLITELSGHNVVKVCTGKSHSLFLTSEGKVLAAGSNSAGQCGVGKGKDQLTTPKIINYMGPDIVDVACGAEFSMILDEEGGVWSFGHPENGTLGHNDDGKFMAKANKVDFRYEYAPLKIPLFVEKDSKSKEITPLPTPKIIKIACGPNHTVAVDDNCKAYSWGFGGYGRLGHAETSDELVPRLIKYLDQKNRGVRDVFCGGAFNIAMSEIKGMVQMWGIYMPNKEANMYPKPVQDLSGWEVRSIACNSKGWLAAADEAVIGCMPSPCVGELGAGMKKKSSAQPTILDTLDKVHVLRVGAGLSHSLFIARNQTEADKKILEKFPVIDQAALD